ncbi:MAG: sigma-70 family RNA polymerase sigma factor, partial [Bacteroidota bacterium]
MSAKINISEAQLVARLKQQDTGVLDLLYANYSKALFGVIFQIVKDRELAEELLQETFLKIWTKSHQYDPAKARLFTWMLTIARNKAIDASRTQKFKTQSQIQSLDDDVSTINYSPSIE